MAATDNEYQAATESHTAARNQKYRPALWFFASTVVLSSMRASAVDLWQAYEVAKSTDPVFVEAKAELAIAVAAQKAAAGGLLPSVVANGSTSRTGGPITFGGSDQFSRPYRSVEWSVRLVVPVVHLEDAASYRQAKSERVAGERRFEVAQQDLIVRLTTSYMDAIASLDRLEAADNEVAASAAQQLLVRQKALKGLVSALDEQEAAVQYSLSMADQAEARANVEVKKAALEEISGPLDSPVVRFRPGARPSAPEPGDVDSWKSAALRGNSSVQADIQLVASAEDNVARVKARRLPTVDAFSAYGRSFSSGNSTDLFSFTVNAYQWQVGLGFSWKIADAGASRALIGEAESRLLQVQQVLERDRRSAVAEAEGAYYQLVASRSRIEALESGVIAAEVAAKGNVAGYRIGVRNNSEVMQSQAKAFAAKSELAIATRDAFLAAVRLKRAAGILDADCVRSISDLISPEM